MNAQVGKSTNELSPSAFIWSSDKSQSSTSEHERTLCAVLFESKVEKSSALVERGNVKLSRLLAQKSIIWARDSLERLPIKLTLENVGVFAVFLAMLMPRCFTYVIIYPLFRLVFGTLYPAYASYKAVRTKNVKEYVKWMMYWIVFALFTCAETFTDVFFSFWFPFYYEIKIILVLWLLSPATKGSSILYRRFVHPALCRREAEIDDALARATEQGYTAVLQLGTKGVNYATNVLMQTAIKNLPIVVSSGALTASQSDPAISSLPNRRTSPSRSETDGRTATSTTTTVSSRQQKQRKRTISEDVENIGQSNPQTYLDVATDSEDDNVPVYVNEKEEFESNYTSLADNNADSAKLADFKKPNSVKSKKRRDDSVTRRKPRTRGASARNFDSDFSDEC